MPHARAMICAGMVPRRIGDVRPPAERLTRLRAKGLWRGRPLGSLLRDTALRLPDEFLLVDGRQRLTAADLLARAEAFARALVEHGIGPGDAIVYQLPNCWEAAVTLLGGCLAGAVVVPVVDILRARELGGVLAEARPRLVVVAAAQRGSDGLARAREAIAAQPDTSAPEIVVVRGATDTHPPTPAQAFDDFVAAGGQGAPLPEPDPAQVAVVIYTSGSTAAPRGAMHSHETLAAELASLATVHGLGPGDVTLMPSPVGHVSGVVHGILAPALLGTRAVLMERWDPAQALALIERERVTYMVGVPTFLQQILDVPARRGHDLSSLRLFSCGGAGVPAELIHRARRELPGLVAKRVYGSSEFPTIATTTAEDALARGGDTEGRAMPGVEIVICDDTGRSLPPGQEGEIRARGPDLFLGWVDPALDHDTLDDAGFLRSGDLGVLDGEGYLRVTGRVKDIIVRKGEKFSAREIEDLLALHPTVVEAAVVPVTDAATGERACACLRLGADAPPPSLAEITAFLRARDLTPQKLPEQLVIVAEFPRAPSGKIDKRRLRADVESGGS